MSLSLSYLQLEPYMDEDFLKAAMMQMGQDGVVSVKVRKVHCEPTPLRIEV